MSAVPTLDVVVCCEQRQSILERKAESGGGQRSQRCMSMQMQMQMEMLLPQNCIECLTG